MIFVFDTVDIILFSVLLSCLVIQLIYYWFYLAKPYYYQRSIEKGKTIPASSQPPVSVIICAKNEAQNLENYLTSFLEQNYPVYEVIVVNDASTDDTDEILNRFSFNHKHLYHTYIPTGSKNLSRKKLGLTLGIKAAKYDTLLFTEADCHPVGPDWISRMARHFTDKRTIVLGFSTLKKQPSRYISYDYFFSNLQMMSLALKNHPYMGNGRNLAYSKNWFQQQRGFSNSNFLDAGEDDLFINEIARKDNLSVELSPESIIQVNLDDAQTWKELKIRRLVTQQFFTKRFAVNFWRMEKVFRILFFLSFIITVFWVISNWILLGVAVFLFLIRFFTQLYVINKTASLLKLPKFYFTLLLFDLIQPFVDEYFYLYKIFRGQKDYNWKYEKR
jgi:cellulose synthase/poly-beta-1,6-N-acetylglucosamine synthase-like glycosyltransferase